MKVFTRMLGIGITALMLLGPLLFSQSSGLQTGTTTQVDKAAVAAENAVLAEIKIVATDYKFDPAEFTVKPGQRVRVMLVNQGKRAHNIQFDLPGGKKQKLPEDIAPGRTGTMEFAVAGPGTFTYICPVPFHATFGMKGKMIVK